MQASANESGNNLQHEERCKLSRWLVSFASEAGWYPVGEFIALHAAAAIERAVEVLGSGAGYQAEDASGPAIQEMREPRTIERLLPSHGDQTIP